MGQNASRQNASTVNLKNSTVQSNVSSSNNWSNLDQLQNQYRQNRNARTLAARTHHEKQAMAYLIAGHGEEKKSKGKFKVPPGCTIVVGRHPYEISYGNLFKEAVSGLIALPEEVIANPIKYSYDIIKAVGSVAIFKEGDECPNFEYKTTLCFPSRNPTMCYAEYGSGVNDIMMMKQKFHNDPDSQTTYKGISLPELGLSSNNLKGLDTDGVVDLISYMYRFSVYPTQDEVSRKIHEQNNWIHRFDWIEPYFSYRNPSVRVPIMSSIDGYQGDMIKQLLNSLTSHISSIKTTQKILCDKFPGVYYNFVCRNDSEKTYNINVFNKVLQKPQTIHNTIKHNTANLLTARLLEAELQRKKHIKNYYNDPKYISKRQNNRRSQQEKLPEIRSWLNESVEYHNNRVRQHKKQLEEDERLGIKTPQSVINAHKRDMKPLTNEIRKFKRNIEILTNRPPNNSGSTYTQLQNGSRKWVKQGGTRKRR